MQENVYSINVLKMNITHNYICTTNKMNDFNNLSYNE